MTDIEIPEGFTRWDGVYSDGPIFEALLRNGGIERFYAGDADWKFGADGPELDIIAYRIVP